MSQAHQVEACCSQSQQSHRGMCRCRPGMIHACRTLARHRGQLQGCRFATQPGHLMEQAASTVVVDDTVVLASTCFQLHCCNMAINNNPEATGKMICYAVTSARHIRPRVCSATYLLGKPFVHGISSPWGIVQAHCSKPHQLQAYSLEVRTCQLHRHDTGTRLSL